MTRRSSLLSGLITLLLLPVFLWLALVWHNNRDADPPSQEEIQEHLQKAKRWLLTHREAILNDNNPMLWWMIKQMVSLRDDQNIRALFVGYKTRYIDPYPNSVWRTLFEPGAGTPLTLSDLSGLPDYNLYFLYGITCDRVLGEMDIVKAQGYADFCPNYHPISPACFTHQLMGVQFLLQRQCGNKESAQVLASAIKAKIYSQLVWDPRVVDVYIQRVLMLVESGSGTRVKPVWIRRILDSQRDDGGWSNVDVMVNVGNSCAFGFNSSGIRICGEAESNFHTTAQGAYLLTQLLHK